MKLHAFKTNIVIRKVFVSMSVQKIVGTLTQLQVSVNIAKKDINLMTMDIVLKKSTLFVPPIQMNIVMW